MERERSAGTTPRRTTLADVAAAAGVSRALASIVMRGAEGAGQATRQRVLEVARELGYRTVRLDTNRTLTEAIAMYERAGYSPTDRYNDNFPKLKSGVGVYLDLGRSQKVRTVEVAATAMPGSRTRRRRRGSRRRSSGSSSRSPSPAASWTSWPTTPSWTWRCRGGRTRPRCSTTSPRRPAPSSR